MTRGGRQDNFSPFQAYDPSSTSGKEFDCRVQCMISILHLAVSNLSNILSEILHTNFTRHFWSVHDCLCFHFISKGIFDFHIFNGYTPSVQFLSFTTLCCTPVSSHTHQVKNQVTDRSKRKYAHFHSKWKWTHVCLNQLSPLPPSSATTSFLYFSFPVHWFVPKSGNKTKHVLTSATRQWSGYARLSDVCLRWCFH